jgi:hypothetical protein
MTPRDDAYTALVAHLSGLTFAGRPITVSRRFRPIDQVPAAEMPLLIVALGDERHEAPHPALPLVRRQTPDIYLYAKAARPEDGGPLIHGLLDVVEAALRPGPGQMAQTLDGKAQACTMPGLVGLWEDLAGTGFVVATFPVTITLP